MTTSTQQRRQLLPEDQPANTRQSEIGALDVEMGAPHGDGPKPEDNPDDHTNQSTKFLFTFRPRSDGDKQSQDGDGGNEERREKVAEHES